MGRYFQEAIETASREELTKIQTEGLRKTVKHAYENIPFYKAKMDELGLTPDDIQELSDLKKLPFLTKNDLREQYPYGLLAVPLKDCVRIQSTSGTTGKRVIAFYTAHDKDVWDECCARAVVAAGGTDEDIVHVSYGYGLFTGAVGLEGGANKVGAMTLPMSSGNTERQIQFMTDLHSTILCCTPSYAASMAEIITERGLKDQLSLKAGIFGAEAWTEEMRRDIEDKLGLKAHDIYGLTETMGPGVSFECDDQTGMHINEDHFIAELIDPDTGEYVEDGQPGELVFTSVDKEAWPLIRYRTRDICILSHEKCSCGRTHVKMSKPMGRSDDMLIVGGVNVFPSQIETVLMKQGYPANYQIIVTRENKLDRLEVQVELPADKFTDDISTIEKLEKELVSGLLQMLGIRVRVKLLAPRTIARSEGKAVRVIDQRNLYKKK